MSAKDGKPCVKCGANEWYKNGACAPCSRAYNKAWRERNPGYQARWARENQDKVQEIRRRFEERHPDYYRDYDREWTKRNRDKKRRSFRKWMAKNRSKNRQRAKEWRQDNLEYAREYDRQYLQDNLDKHAANQRRRRTRKAGNGGDHTAAEFKQLCDLYDNRCLRCGKKKKLTADHVEPICKGGSNDISNIQPLCIRCNSAKGTRSTDYRTKPGIKRWIQKRLI